MKYFFRRAFFAAIVASRIMAADPAAQPKPTELHVGDKAPPLTILQWLKGSPLPAFEPGHLYVVEMGATWCPPCRKAIPHLTELTKRYADKVTVVSVFVFENRNKEDVADLSYVDKVKYLINTMGDKMDYNIAVDVPQQTTASAWGIQGVPTAFVIDGSGKVAWIGYPMELDPVLGKITAGTFQAADTAREQKAFMDSLDSIMQLKKDGDYRQALAKLDPIIEAHPEQSYLYIMKYQVLAGDDDLHANALLVWLLTYFPHI